MHKLILPIAVSVAFAASDLIAQRGGSSNTRSPRVSQSISFADDTEIEISYRSLTWAQGRTMASLKENARAREALNNDSRSNPLGSFSANADVTVGGKKVAKGEYTLYFKIDDDLAWHLVLEHEDGKATTWKLDLKQEESMNTRLCLTLTAGDKDTDAVLSIAFGKMACTVDLSSKVEKKAEEAGIR